MKYSAVVIGGSAGSFQGVSLLLSSLEPSYPLPILLCLHRLKDVRHGVAESLNFKSRKPVLEPLDKEQIKPGNIYLAPSNYHLCVEHNYRLSLSTEELVNHSRPSIDMLMTTAASVYGRGLVGILLSGANKDGAQGMKNIADAGGTTLVQEPTECAMNVMPLAAIAATRVDHVLPVKDIARFLQQIVLEP